MTKPQTIVSSAVADFLRHLRERNASPHTIKAYSGDLGPFELKSLLSLAQLHDMLAAEHSTIVTQKRDHARGAGPE